ncbi:MULTISPECIES: DDE-type integrase/transposase/recombinase [Azospirillum]|uniref:DDE-type integrase/transposase/recombinase n=1 Tax=Azospirillum lipoferum TaxID=193 RepID=A0A5A9GQG0_AZOLI|nr:DDE-type integrase/transposase/recombinase [Azospirillum lipoferum]
MGVEVRPRRSQIGCAGGAPHRGGKWHLDEVVLTIAGRRHYLWRAVERDGFVVKRRRDAKAAKRLAPAKF